MKKPSLFFALLLLFSCDPEEPISSIVLPTNLNTSIVVDEGFVELQATADGAQAATPSHSKSVNGMNVQCPSRVVRRQKFITPVCRERDGRDHTTRVRDTHVRDVCTTSPRSSTCGALYRISEIIWRR